MSRKKPSDTELLSTYMLGFNDELWNKKKVHYTNDLMTRAYRNGRDDAIIGDDVSSNDNQSNETILRIIKNEKLKD